MSTQSFNLTPIGKNFMNPPPLSWGKNDATKPQGRRTLKIFLGFGCLGLILIGALAIWAAVAAFQGVAGLAREANVPEKVVSLQRNIQDAASLPMVGCWQAAQDLLRIEVWLEKPIADNLATLSRACLDKPEE